MKYLISILLLAASIVQGADIIDGGALQPFPASAEYSITVHKKPGTNEVVTLNPPKFSWCYSFTMSTLNSDSVQRNFRFQVSTNIEFTNNVIDVWTDFNFYNALSPFANTNLAHYWRVGYVNVGTTTTNWFTNVFYFAGNCAVWDRSKIGDTNYILARATHPHMIFNSTNRAALLTWLDSKMAKYNAGTGEQWEKDVGLGWLTQSNACYGTMGQAWMTAIGEDTYPYPAISQATWGANMTAIAYVYGVRQDAAILASGAIANLTNMAQYFVTNLYYKADSSINYSQNLLKALAYGYDYFYNDMDAEQRALVLKALDWNAQYMLRVGDPNISGFMRANTRAAYDFADPTTYSAGFYIDRSSLYKKGTSHGESNFRRTLYCAMAGFGESTNCLELLQKAMNYDSAINYFNGGEEGMNQGRGYAAQNNNDGRQLITHIAYNNIFPEVGFNLNPFIHGILDWWDLNEPVGLSPVNGAFGDAEYGYAYIQLWRDWEFMRHNAYFISTNNPVLAGRVLQHADAQRAVDSGALRTIADMEDIVIPYFYGTNITNQVTTEYAKTYKSAGFTFAHSKSPSTHEAFTNGVGFFFISRPSGCEAGHSAFNDLSFQLYAYGSVITDAGGASIYGYSQIPSSHYCLLVNGRGPAQNAYYPTQPYYSKVFAFTNTESYTYVAADGTHAYPMTPITPSSATQPSTWVTLHSTGALGGLQKVNRHVLMMKRTNPYFVIYDSMEISTNSHFSFLYPILSNTVYNLDTNALSFAYSANTRKYLGYVPSAPEVTNLVVSINISNKYITNLTTTNVYKNLQTGEDYYSNTYSSPTKRSNTIWIESVNQDTNFHFMTVIYPVKPGNEMPTITRLDNYTVAITNGAEGDIISFSPSNSIATLKIDLPAMSLQNEYVGYTPLDTNIYAPAVTNLAPVNGAIIVAGDVAFSYQIVGGTGSVTNAITYTNGAAAHTNTTSPWAFTNTLTAGSYTCYVAIATSDGTNNVSATNVFTVESAPTVSITSPINGLVFTTLPVSFTAVPVASVGTISSVSFFVDGTLIGSDTADPYTASSSPANGYHTVTASVLDSHGLTNISPGIQFRVNISTPVITRSGRGILTRRQRN